MNIDQSRTEDSPVTPARRVSARAKQPLAINSKFFQRPYKRENSKAVVVASLKSDGCRATSQNTGEMLLIDLSEKVFQKLPESRKQTKAIRSFRVKKLKRLMAGRFLPGQNPNGALIFIKRQLELYSCALRSIACKGRSLSAISRNRSSKGKFLSSHNPSVFEDDGKTLGNLEMIQDWEANQVTCSQTNSSLKDCETLTSTNCNTFEDLNSKLCEEDIGGNHLDILRDFEDQVPTFSFDLESASLPSEDMDQFLKFLIKSLPSYDENRDVDLFWDIFQKNSPLNGCLDHWIDSKANHEDLFINDPLSQNN